MPNVTEILATMDYGPNPESADVAQAWLKHHDRRFGVFIGGRWLSGRQTFESSNPANGQTLCTLTQATPALVDKAVQAAQAAQPGWAALSIKLGRLPPRFCQRPLPPVSKGPPRPSKRPRPA